MVSLLSCWAPSIPLHLCVCVLSHAPMHDFLTTVVTLGRPVGIAKGLESGLAGSPLEDSRVKCIHALVGDYLCRGNESSLGAQVRLSLPCLFVLSFICEVSLSLNAHLRSCAHAQSTLRAPTRPTRARRRSCSRRPWSARRL